MKFKISLNVLLVSIIGFFTFLNVNQVTAQNYVQENQQEDDKKDQDWYKNVDPETVTKALLFYYTFFPEEEKEEDYTDPEMYEG